MAKLNSLYDIEDILDVKETNRGTFVFYLVVEYKGTTKESVKIFTDRNEAVFYLGRIQTMYTRWSPNHRVELIEKVVD